jgi:hypothetical protein
MNPVSTDGCKGLFWRGSVNCYTNQYANIIVKKSLTRLKALSCPGCEECDWLLEFLHEDVANGKDYLGSIEHGKIYTFKVHSSQGYYDLYPEIDNIEFVLWVPGEEK